MNDQTYFDELCWRVTLAEYAEFCDDLQNGLKDLSAIPQSHVRYSAHRYAQLPLDEARRIFRSAFYIRNPSRAARQWGLDPSAPGRYRSWIDDAARHSAPLGDTTSEFITRLKIQFAKRYCRFRGSQDHEQALKSAMGTPHPQVDEERLRMLGAVRLASAKLIRKRLTERADAFSPLLLSDSLSKQVLRFDVMFGAFRHRLKFVIEDGVRGGVTCHIEVRRPGKDLGTGFAIDVADPPWDIITVESLNDDINLLLKRIQIRLQAVLPEETKENNSTPG